MTGSLVKTIGRFFQRALASRWLERVSLAMFVLSLALVSFIAGAYVAEFNTRWYKRVVKPSFDGLRAFGEQRGRDWKMDGWCVAREQKTGTGEYQSDIAYDGLTLYTTMGAYPSATLLSMNGEVVHEWQLSFRKAWSGSSEGSRSVSEDHTHWRRVRLFPNGDLIANYSVLGATPYGGGLVRIDKDSQLVWRYPEHVHHDFDVDDAGRVYALTHSNRKKRVAAARHLKVPMTEDFVVVLSPEGKELQKIAIFDAFAKSKFRHYLDSIPSDPKGDHTHTNDVEVISEAFAKHHKFCSAGDLIISIRNTSVLAILNLEREEIVWAARGIWEFQHDPDPLDNGNLLIFDNEGNKGSGGKSRILEWNPSTGAVEWCYIGDADNLFESRSRGCQQLLPNGNVLITESNNGRIVEVTRDRKVVWEYFNPHRDGKDDELVAVVYSAQRYRADELNFLSPQQVARFGGKVSTAAMDKSDSTRP